MPLLWLFVSKRIQFFDSDGEIQNGHAAKSGARCRLPNHLSILSAQIEISPLCSFACLASSLVKSKDYNTKGIDRHAQQAAVHPYPAPAHTSFRVNTASAGFLRDFSRSMTANATASHASLQASELGKVQRQQNWARSQNLVLGKTFGHVIPTSILVLCDSCHSPKPSSFIQNIADLSVYQPISLPICSLG